MVNALDAYNIDIYKLQNGIHEYEFRVNPAFFEALDQELITEGNGLVKVQLEKTDSMINLDLNIDIKVRLTCDRSLEEFDYPLTLTKFLVLKFGEEFEELDEDLLVIEKNTQRINLAHHIYDHVALAIPMKKLHPKFADETDEDELIYSSADENSDDSKEEEEIDPRWKALKDLKKD